VISTPARYIGQPVAKQAEYDAIAERIAYANPRVASLLAVPAARRQAQRPQHGRVHDRAAVRQRQSTPLYAGLPGPADRDPPLQRTYELWGYVRPAEGATQL